MPPRKRQKVDERMLDIIDSNHLMLRALTQLVQAILDMLLRTINGGAGLPGVVFGGPPGGRPGVPPGGTTGVTVPKKQ